MPKAKVFISRLNSIFHNLAFEDRLFEKSVAPAMMLYRNDKTIVIGRNQNPWKECHVDRMRADGVELCRRKSGGGAVYQDLGNSVFSFFTTCPAGVDFKQINNGLLVQALSRLGVQAEVKGRNDITLDGKKISGSAYKLVTRGNMLYSLHHGTMLFSVDKEGLQKYLNPNKAKMLSKGIQSVSARVMNITEQHPSLTHESWCDAMVQNYTAAHGEVDIEYVEKLDSETSKAAQQYLDWEWRFGSSPTFSHSFERRFEWGTMDVNLEVKGGAVAAAKVFSDSLFPDFIDKVNEALVGVKYGAEGLEQLRTKLQDCTDPLPKYVEDIVEWLRKEM